MRFSQYDVVRIVAIHEPAVFEPDACNERPPRIGDVACIVEIHTDPDGYELECCEGGDGRTTWLMSFAPTAIELERAE